jgi:hypothetical protein
MNMPERRDAWIHVPHAPLAPMAPWHFGVASETEGRGYLLQIASLGSLTATPPRLNPSVCKNSQKQVSSGASREGGARRRTAEFRAANRTC